MLNLDHLNSIELRLSNERARLANAKTEGEKQLRKVWVNGIEKELEDEKKFLGINSVEIEMDEEDLLAELFA